MTNTHTVRAFDEELNLLNSSLLKMGGLVRDSVALALSALETHNPELVEKALRLDERINSLDLEIEHQATVVLALRNPMAGDLRFVTSSLKMATIFERMGDISKKITLRAMQLGEGTESRFMDKLKEMAKFVTHMIDIALSALEEINPEKSETLWTEDDTLDKMYQDMFAMAQQAMVADPKKAQAYTYIVFVAKNFERMGDYVTNLAKSINYVSFGQRSYQLRDKAATAG